MDQKSGLSNNFVTSFLTDGKGYWIGTDGGGLNYFDPASKTFNYVSHQTSKPNGINGNHILSLLSNGPDSFWIGYYDSGLDLFDTRTKTIKHFGAGDNTQQISGT